MQKRIIFKNGKKYIVNTPDWSDALHGLDLGIGQTGAPLVGSFKFGYAGALVTSSASDDWAPYTGSYTVEWYQYQTSQPGGTFPRVFTVKVWPSSELGVSIETGPIFYLWTNATGNPPGAVAATINTPYLNQWVHFAVVRSSGSFVRIFQDGAILNTFTGSNAVVTNNLDNTTSSLEIGGESGVNAATTRFPGLITNFRWLKGVALYSASFTPSTIPLMAIDGTKLLLRAETSDTLLTDMSGLNHPLTASTTASWMNSSSFSF